MEVSKGKRVGIFFAQHLCFIITLCACILAVGALIGLTIRNPPVVTTKKVPSANEPVMGANDTNLFWFAHVSDIHLSIFHPWQVQHFQDYVNATVPTINPAFVVAGGDLTDGFTTSNLLQPGQVEVSVFTEI